jgi:hypothetical protein
MNWLGYCLNKSCKSFKQLSVINRGFGSIKFVKDLVTQSCPVCKEHQYEFRNIGFVNCEWGLKGKLFKREESKIYAEGKTYDGKLYTFKETNYALTFEMLEIAVEKLKE